MNQENHLKINTNIVGFHLKIREAKKMFSYQQFIKNEEKTCKQLSDQVEKYSRCICRTKKREKDSQEMKKKICDEIFLQTVEW